jgi:hypothetical protein
MVRAIGGPNHLAKTGKPCSSADLVGKRFFFLLFVALTLATTSATVARADDATARAQQLKKQGDAAMDSLRYDEALSAYKAAYDLSHDPAILYNVGQVRRARGEYPEALDSFEAFDQQAPPELKARVPTLPQLIAEVRGKVATVTITTNVAGARVLVRERIVGTTPLEKPIRVGAGKALVEIDAAGHLPYRKELDLAGGSATVLDAKLESSEARGVLVVHANAGASVLVDGKLAGNAPVELTVAPGSHEVLVRREGFEDNASSAVIRSGERRELDVTLAARSSIVQKWWFWTGVGVVVAGGVVATVLAVMLPRGPDAGDGFQPGTLGAPLRW